MADTTPQTTTAGSGEGTDTSTDTSVLAPGATTDEGGKPAADKPADTAGKPAEGDPTTAKPDDKGGDAGKKADGDVGKPDEPVAFDPAKLSLPEGVELDPKLMDVFKPIADEFGLPQDKAQALIDMHVQSLKNVADAAVAHLDGLVAKQRNDWLEEVRKDPVLCKPENQKLASSVLTRFGATDALKKVLTESGLGNHPDLVRLFHNIALKIAEDNPAALGDDGKPAGANLSLEDRLYGGTKT